MSVSAPERLAAGALSQLLTARLTVSSAEFRGIHLRAGSRRLQPARPALAPLGWACLLVNRQLFAAKAEEGIEGHGAHLVFIAEVLQRKAVADVWLVLLPEDGKAARAGSDPLLDFYARYAGTELQNEVYFRRGAFPVVERKA